MTSLWQTPRRFWRRVLRPRWRRVHQFVFHERIRRSFADARRSTAALGRISGQWPGRIRLACECPDNAWIPRVPDAGKLEQGLITMHNGLKVSALGYYGAGILNLLVQNRGVHEPQEERVFGQALKTLRDAACMIELGAYWGFYSMWFQRDVPGGVNYLVEPLRANLESGRLNFELNGMRGDFTRAWVGGPTTKTPDGGPLMQLDDFARAKGIPFVHLLHCDIQGAEQDMLDGARRLFGEHRVGYLFLSTHSELLHTACRERLETIGYRVIASATPAESYTCDGVLVMRSSRFGGLAPVEISRRPAHAARGIGSSPSARATA